MAGLWVVGEVNPDGTLARLSSEVATMARGLAEAAGTSATGVVVAEDPAAAAKELATYLPRVLTITEPVAAEHAWSTIAAERIAALVRGAGDEAPDHVLLGAGPDGRDVAGVLSALLGWGVLVNATSVAWKDGPVVDMSAFGGRLLTSSGFTGDHGIVTVRQNVVSGEPLPKPGAVAAAPDAATAASLALPVVRLLEHVEEAGAAAPIEEARIIVAGGRGVGGADGFALVEEIAAQLGGAVGATRAAVDSGWIPYAQQIGQTGKIVKPKLYLALGISGAIQHKVGMQTAETIIAINRDPDAPIADFADLLVVGDLFDVGRALLAELRARTG
ncbi:MAG: electron transfer flavoprotein subunit alpha/FixB family protein [Chloroflexi bacterium]|nr:electron transfer flavoprotein subunit alpha/FixB family protein [Chloroflexota bacterium]